MKQQGTIETVGVTTLFELLSQGQQTGVLLLARPGTSVSILFKQGGVVYASSASKEGRLGDLLVKGGSIAADDRDKALAIQKEMGGRLGEILIKEGKLSEDDLAKFLQAQAEEALFSVLQWTQGTFEFQEGPPPEDPFLEFPETIQKLFRENKAELDELKEVLKSFPNRNATVLLKDSPETRNLNLNLEQWQVYAKVDGKRSIRGVCEESSFTDLQTLRTLKQLSLMGAVTIEGQGQKDGEGKGWEEDLRLLLFAEVYGGILAKTFEFLQAKLGKNAFAIARKHFNEFKQRYSPLLDPLEIEPNGTLSIPALLARIDSEVSEGRFEKLREILNAFFISRVVALKDILGEKVLTPFQASLPMSLEEILGLAHETLKNFKKEFASLSGLLQGAQSSFELGKNAYQEGDFARAASLLEKVQVTHPNYGEAYTLLEESKAKGKSGQTLPPPPSSQTAAPPPPPQPEPEPAQPAPHVIQVPPPPPQPEAPPIRTSMRPPKPEPPPRPTIIAAPPPPPRPTVQAPPPPPPPPPPHQAEPDSTAEEAFGNIDSSFFSDLDDEVDLPESAGSFSDPNLDTFDPGFSLEGDSSDNGDELDDLKAFDALLAEDTASAPIKPQRVSTPEPQPPPKPQPRPAQQPHRPQPPPQEEKPPISSELDDLANEFLAAFGDEESSKNSADGPPDTAPEVEGAEKPPASGEPSSDFFSELENLLGDDEKKTAGSSKDSAPEPPPKPSQTTQSGAKPLESQAPPTKEGAEALFNEGIQFYRKSQFSAGIEKFEAALAVDPKHVEAGRYLQMAQDKMVRTFKDLIKEEDVLRVDQGKSTTAKISSRQGYILSRMDGRLTVKEVCRICGLRTQDFIAEIAPLIENSIVLLPKDRLAEAKEAGVATSKYSILELPPLQPEPSDYQPPPDVDRLEARMLERKIRGQIILNIRKFDTQDYYQFLGIKRGTPKPIIKKAYLLKAKVCNPQVIRMIIEKDLRIHAKDLFRKYTHAFEVLMDDEKRALYHQFLREIEDAGKAKKNEASLLFQQGMTAFHEQRFTEALDFFQNAIRVSPWNPVYHDMLNEVKVLTQDKRGAVRWKSALMALKENDFADAVKHMKSALEVNPTNLTWLRQLVETYRKLPDLREESIEFWNKVIELEPTNPDNYLEAARILMHLRKKREAVEYFYNAYRWSEEKNEEAKKGLAELKAAGIIPEDIKKKDDSDKARKAYEKAKKSSKT